MPAFGHGFWHSAKHDFSAKERVIARMIHFVDIAVLSGPLDPLGF